MLVFGYTANEYLNSKIKYKRDEEFTIAIAKFRAVIEAVGAVKVKSGIEIIMH